MHSREYAYVADLGQGKATQHSGKNLGVWQGYRSRLIGLVQTWIGEGDFGRVELSSLADGRVIHCVFATSKWSLTAKLSQLPSLFGIKG